MTATILPRDRSSAVRIGEPSIRSVVSYPRPVVRPAPTEDVEYVCAKGFVFIDWPRRCSGNGCGGGGGGRPPLGGPCRRPPARGRGHGGQPGPRCHWYQRAPPGVWRAGG